jgi:hypothetical protein
MVQMNQTEMAKELTAVITGGEVPAYDSPMGRGGPVMNRRDGKSTNPWNYVTHVPGIERLEDTQKYVIEHDKTEQALLDIAVTIVDEWVTQDDPEWGDIHTWDCHCVYMWTYEVVGRYYKGALGEIFVADKLIDELAEEREGDESKGIDLREKANQPGEEETTYSVKTTEEFGDENFRKTNADKYVRVLLKDGAIERFEVADHPDEF